MKRRAHRRLGAALLGAALAFAAVEAIARAVPWAAEEGFYGYPDGLLVPDGPLGWRYRPGFRGRFRGARYAEIEISTNARGFRGPEIAPTPAPGVLRVVALGDSIAFGAGVREEDAWPRRLEAELRRTVGAVEVANLGVNHYDLTREARLLETDALPLRPRLAVVGFCLNDGGGFEEGSGEVGRPPVVAVLRSSAAARLAHRALAGLSGRYAASYDRLHLSRIERAWDAEGEARVAAALSRMARATKDAGVRLVIAAFPHRTELEGFASAIPGRLRRLCEIAGIAHLDLRSAYAASGGPALFLPGDAWHPDAEGHAVAARALAAFLVSETP